MNTLIIENITIDHAKEIAEFLGGGGVVWSQNKCYPTSKISIQIFDATPPARKPLSEKKLEEMWRKNSVRHFLDYVDIARIIEAAHGIGVK